MYGNVMLDVSNHMFGWLDGIRNLTEYEVSTSHTYRIQLCEVKQFYMINRRLIRKTTSKS